MKKYVLLFLFISLFNIANSQVSFLVLQPPAIAGGYNFTYNSPPFWGVPDLSVPANSVTGSVVLAYDATAADSLGCETLVTDVTGKIALVYRGTCFHDEKAFVAQEAGAIGIILINNAPGQMPPVSGLNPGLITIPLTIISDEAGVLMREQLEAGEDVQVFIGNTIGYFGNDLGLSSKSMLIPSSTLLPLAIAQNASEFDMNLGAWIYNFGSNDQSPSLTAKIYLDGTEIYSNISENIPLSTGDSAYVALPTFSQPSYDAGTYELIYEVTGAEDELAFNNSISHKILLNENKFGLVKVNSQGAPATTSGGFRAGTNTAGNVFQSCIVFRNAHASRLIADGLSFYSSTPFGTSIVGEVIEIRALEWNDVFTGISDSINFDVANIVEKAYGIYDYQENLQSVTVSQNFEEPFIMENNKRYLFCITAYDEERYLGFDSNIHYEKNIEDTDQPVMALFINDEFSPGFIPPAYPSIILNTSASEVSLTENQKLENLPFPNPTNSIVNIPWNGSSGNAVLSIVDVSAKKISTQNLKIVNHLPLNVDVNGFEKGIYNFNLVFENGKVNTFKVVIN